MAERMITLPLPTDIAGIRALVSDLLKIAILAYLVWTNNKTYNVQDLLVKDVAPAVEQNTRKLDAVKSDTERTASKADTITRTMLTK